MDFKEIVKEVLNEELAAGGEGSVFGSGVVNTSSAFSGDNYAPGDARNPYGIYGGILSRKGLASKKKRKKRKKKKTSK
jgi:hypothetical protein